MKTLFRSLVTLSIGASLVASVASQNPPPAASPPMVNSTLPPAQLAGLWNTDFGPVKMEADPTVAGGVRGVWQYMRPADGANVIGYFAGQLAGNVLHARWNEPGVNGQPSLEGYATLRFAPGAASFSGTWSSTAGDRKGTWNGTRDVAAPAPIAPPYPQQQYPQQPYPQQPYPQQTYPQPYPQQPVPQQYPPTGQPYPQSQPAYPPQPQPYPLDGLEGGVYTAPSTQGTR